jgi:coenzyme F420-reducing hydrogenase delta subunit
VLVLACSEEACHYMEGSARSHKRADYAKSWLTRLGIQPERVRFIHFRPMDLPGLDKELLEFATKLESFGTIPALTKIAG